MAGDVAGDVVNDDVVNFFHERLPCSGVLCSLVRGSENASENGWLSVVAFTNPLRFTNEFKK